MTMRRARGLILGLAFVSLVVPIRVEAQDGLVGVGAVRPICDPNSSSSECISGDEQVQDEIITALEADEQVTAAPAFIELGELLCESLDEAPGSTLLRFAMSSTETVTAERTSYTEYDGDVFTNNKERKVWRGIVVDPAPPAGTTPRTVSMTWGTPCDVNAFVLKMIGQNPDGTTSVTTSVTCDAGSSTDVCMVQYDIDLPPSDEPLEPVRDLGDAIVDTSNGARLLQERVGRDGGAIAGSSRSLQSTTVVDIIFVYSSASLARATVVGVTAQEMENLIANEVPTMNEATANSEVDLVFNLVHTAPLPYTQDTENSNTELNKVTADATVKAMRDAYAADLVILVGSFPGTCGLGWVLQNTAPGDEGYGYSLIDARCFEGKTTTHEVGHNMGCLHDRDNHGGTPSAYSHGLRYCTGDPATRFLTIMAYYCNYNPPPDYDSRGSEAIPYFSNPDVFYNGLPTGTATENNARVLRENMEVISNFRDASARTCTEAGGSGGTVANSICNDENNNAVCGYDGGDCCDCDCVRTSSWSCVAAQNQVGQAIYVIGNTNTCENLVAADVEDCGYFDGNTCNCSCVADDVCDQFDCVDPASTCAPTHFPTPSPTPECTVNEDCDIANGEICCPVKNVCEVDVSPGACGDPHFQGFKGQKFDFTGKDGAWYAVLSTQEGVHLNMRVTCPVPDIPEITYITGISIKATDSNNIDHTIVITVTDPYRMDSHCPEGVYPCLADGALSVELDGEPALVAPGQVILGPDVAVSAANLPGECRSFGFDKYWERKKADYAKAGRRLKSSEGLQEMAEWILGDPTATNKLECIEYVARAMEVGGDAGLFAHNSEHATFQILTPVAKIRLSHGRLHQLPMRDPTDRFDLPEHFTWQQNLAIDHQDLSLDATGILGETLVPTIDDQGKPIMQGMDAIRGSQEDYRVEGPLGTTFVQDIHHW